MISSLFSTAKAVGKRLAGDWLIAVAGFVTILLSTVLLAAGPIYADAVTISALQQRIGDAPATEANISASVSIFPEFYAEADPVVRETIENSLATTGTDLFAHIEAEAFEISDQAVDDEPIDLASLHYFEDLESRAKLLEGVWPQGNGVQTAILQPAADRLGLGVGDEIDLTNRRDPSLTVDAAIVGIYAVDDPSDPYWLEEEVALSGMAESGSFRALGPFVVSLDTMLTELTPTRVDADWRALPRHGNLTVSGVGGLRQEVADLALELDTAVFAAIDRDASGASGFSITTGLAPLLSDVDRSLTVTQSSVLAVLVQLAILAGYALALTARLLVDARRTETALLRSRGSSPGRVLTMSVMEGLALTLPAVVTGPYLAALLLRLLNTMGPLTAIGLEIDPTPNLGSHSLAAVAALIAVATLAWPAYRSARSFGEPVHRKGRSPRATAAQRLGVDLGLLVVALAAFWQLQELGPEISNRIRGRFGVDPLLVLAPALGLAAGALVALRLVPLLARLAERIATARRSTISALASWQVARRPVRYARSSLLLIIAIGIGFFAASYSTTWISSQRDQAAHTTGADIVVRPDRSSGAPTDLQLPAAHTSIAGVDHSMAVSTARGRLPGEGGIGQFVILDAAKAPDVVTVRPDLAPDFSHQMDLLVSARPDMASLDLPGEARSLRMTFDAVEELPEIDEPNAPEPRPGFQARVRIVIQDGDGVLHRIDGGTIPVNEGPADLRFELLGPNGETPTYPLGLVSVEIESQVPDDYSRDVELTLRELSALQEGGRWADVSLEDGTGPLSTQATRVFGTSVDPSIASTLDETGLRMEIATGLGPFAPAPTYFTIRPGAALLPEAFPVIVSESFPDTVFVGAGEEVRLPALRSSNNTASIAGTLGAFPTENEGLGEVVILDLPTYQMIGYEPGVRLDSIDAYWLASSGDDSQAVSALQGPPFDSFEVGSASDLAETLVSDPVALGTIGALTMGFVAATVFAAVGFTVSATVSARERLVEFALLRALGLSPRQLGSWLVVEQSALVVVSLALGTAVGLVLTAAILPLISLTQDGAPAVPAPIIEYPWSVIAGMEIAVLAVLGVIVIVMSAALRRLGLGSLLRLGED